MKEGRSAFKILAATPAGKRHLGRPRRRWEDNIRKDLKKICINMRNWVMEPGGSMPQSQGLSNNPYPDRNQYNSSY